MATASAVPETYHLEGDDATDTLQSVGWSSLLKDSFTRFRTADGLSQARAFGHACVLVALPALITIIGLASSFEWTTFREVLQHTLKELAPGPTARLLQSAFRQGAQGGHGVWISALIATLVGGAFLMAQVERGFNRIYGMERDRAVWSKLGLGLVMMLTAGLLLGLGFVVLAAGGPVIEALSRSLSFSEAIGAILSVVRWPLGLVFAFVGLTILYKVSPNRTQPGAGWLQTATVMAAVLWFAMTALLALYYSTGQQIETYGSLLGVIALLSWAYATGLAAYFGMAFAAQLEALRAGVPGPRTLRRYNEAVRDPSQTKELADVKPRPVSGEGAGTA
jgi:YihY family inner membrane protein